MAVAQVGVATRREVVVSFISFFVRGRKHSVWGCYETQMCIVVSLSQREDGALAYVACCVESAAPGSASSAACASNDPPRASCGLSPMHVSAARQLALVPDVDACALSPLDVEFMKVFAGAGAPPDRDLGSDAANRHPASPLVASELGERAPEPTQVIVCRRPGVQR